MPLMEVYKFVVRKFQHPMVFQMSSIGFMRMEEKRKERKEERGKEGERKCQNGIVYDKRRT